jgi:predicted nucleic acid-binding protein
MNAYVCLDSSVLIKVLTWEEGSELAARLLERIFESNQVVVLSGFAWAEVGSVLRQKVTRKEIEPDEADAAWEKFCGLRLLVCREGENLWNLAWRISVEENLPTLYDAAYLAVSELAAKESDGGKCLFWTADEKLANSVQGRKNYIRVLSKFTNPGELVVDL